MDIDDSFGPVFTRGIRIPRNVTLPNEFIQAYAYMGLAELKVTLAAIIQFMRIGGAEPITFSEFMALTGLSSKASIQSGIDAAMRRGILTRYEVQGYRGHISYVYEIQTVVDSDNFISTESVPINPLVKLSVDVKTTDIDTTTVNSTAVNYDRQKNIFTKLRTFGVFPNTANSLISKYSFDDIEALIELFPDAQRVRLADGVGWLVRAIQNQWSVMEIREEIDARTRVEAPNENGIQRLPDDIKYQLKRLGWTGPVNDVLLAYSKNPDLVSAWLSYVRMYDHKFKNPAGVFRKGIRSNEFPPEFDSEADDIDYGYSTIDDEPNQEIEAAVLDSLGEQVPKTACAEVIKPAGIPEGILEVWHEAFQQIKEAYTNNYISFSEDNFIPHSYADEVKLFWVSVNDFNIYHWANLNIRDQFEEIFFKQLSQHILVFFSFQSSL